MAEKKKDKGFLSNINSFFKRVDNQDLIKFGDESLVTTSAPISKQEDKKKQEMQVFRQYLQQKNWNIKHTELFDEYRRMDSTYPIINAALRLYSQEICLSGDVQVLLSSGPRTIKSLFEEGKTGFYVKSYDAQHDRVTFNTVNRIVCNGVKPVFKVTVNRNIDAVTSEWDTIGDANFKCTDNHKIMVKPGEFKELKDLKIGDKIWSMYQYKDPSCGCLKNISNETVIENIEPAGEELVYDLVDVSPHHHFLIKLTDSFNVTVHNCTKNSDDNVIEIISDNKRVKKLLEECFFKNLKLNSTAYLHTRMMLKFGNHFCFLDTRQGVGVMDLYPIPPEFMRIAMVNSEHRIDEFRYNWFGTGGGIEFEPWEVVHWKNLEDIETEPYGISILRSIVDTYRRIILMREAMIVYRITRAPQRLLFKLDTSGYDADQALRYAEDLKKQMYKKPLINPVTGELDHKYNPISIEENLYMGTSEGDVSDVKVLEGASNLDAVEDYGVIKDDLYAGLLIPKAYLTFEEDLCLRADTKVKTNEGVFTMKEISDMFEEDKNKKIHVLSCNPYGIISTGKVLWAEKTKEVTEIYKITVNGHSIVESTDNHPFLMSDLNYKRADLLKVNDKLKGMFDDDYLVTEIEVITLDEPEFVYDMEVDKYHNFALDNGIFVHNSSKAALAQEDLRFAGAVRQYQSHFIEGLLHIGLVHLHINGCSIEELNSFSIKMHTNSNLAEKTRMELVGQRLDIAAKAWDAGNNGLNFMSFTQVLKEILHFTNEEIEKSIQDQLVEKKLIWRLGKLTEDGVYDDPDVNGKKLYGMKSDNDIFSNLNFESISQGTFKSIITEKVDEEIRFLTRPVQSSAYPKLISQIVDSDYKFENKFLSEKVKKNAFNTLKDIS